jgi:S-adenosylmethionine/arginine decarboxylase-like enzyme
LKTEGIHIILDIWLTKNIPWRKLKNVFAKLLTDSGQMILSFQEWEYHPYGNSGVFLIAASHASIHTYPEHKYVSFDIYSCKTDFNYTQLIKRLYGMITIESTNVTFVNRGRRKT